MGKTAIPFDHPLCTGLIGMHGTIASNKAVCNADLIIALGARFSDRVISNPATFAHQAKILHIDIDAAEINKNIKAALSLVGDLKHILARLIPLVDGSERSERRDWTKLVDSWKSLAPPAYTDGHAKLYPRVIYETIHKVSAEVLGAGDNKPILVTDVGQHQMWAAQFYPFTSPRSFLTSGGLGTMGYGMGAAIGAQVGNPDRHVVLAVGDGGFRMSANELATISHYGFPVIILIMNNGTLGMVRQWQRLFYDKRYAATTLDFGPDFLKLADAYGIRSFRADTDETFAAAFRTALSERSPALIDCRLDMDELVLPMVPGGKPIDQGLLELT
jgi:acetolactate synthase-1/2/3 large subunit